ncbi:uncharacterized protein LOC112590122 [Rhizophagus clarus]|uniref:Uncharacterized protein LOC112590122 n=1 Tax=Rhizophagus clarus TaxID=94130 RepID=A0A8H3LL56_9GLOM|nr:uncharacterized protein LOC112590122 [Rhizophagus clarus]
MPFGLCNAPATFQRTMNKAEKCHFRAKELQFLGHVVGEEGIKPDPEKIDKIVNYPIPVNIRDLRGVLGLFLYYRYASLIGIGAVLAQKDGKDEYVDAYANHSALKWLLNSSSETANRWLERWKIILSEYDYEIQYRKGTKYFNANVLSRINPNTVQYLDALTVSDHYSSTQKAKIHRISSHYILQNNLLYRRIQNGFKRVILHKQIESIFYHLHQDLNAAHLEIDAVFEKVKEHYYWPQMFEDIKNYINICDTYQRRGSQQRVEPLIPIKVGTSFVNQIIDKLCENYQTKHRLTSPYRPQTNGMVECFNRTLGETKKHSTTGFTSFYLVYRRQVTLPIDLKLPNIQEKDEQNPLLARLYRLIENLETDRQEVIDIIDREQQKQKEQHNQQRISVKLKIGDKVLVE